MSKWIETFSSPVNRGSRDALIDANAVRGNDNALGTALNKINVGDIRRFGAKGNFVAGGTYADDTAAVLNTIYELRLNGGGVMLVPPGRFWVTDTILFPGNVGTPPQSDWLGVSVQGSGANASRFVCTDTVKDIHMSDRSVLFFQGNNASIFCQDIGIDGPNPGLCSAVTNAQAGGTPAAVRCIGIIYDFIKYGTLARVDINGCAVGVDLISCQGCSTFAVHATDQRDAGLWVAAACESIVIFNSTYQVTNASGDAVAGEYPANVKITDNGFGVAPRNIYLAGNLFDEIGFNSEGGGASVDIQHGKDITVERAVVYCGGKQQPGGDPYYGIHIRDGASRVHINSVRVEPYVADDVRVPNATIQIDAGATGVSLTDISTNPNAAFGGIDIVDLAADTTYLNVNGHSRMRGDLKRSSQTIAFATPLVVNAVLGDYLRVGALTANLVIGVPLNPALDQRLTWWFLQDATGGRTVTFNAVFLTSYVNTGNVAGTRSSIAFVYDGTNWVQEGAQRLWA